MVIISVVPERLDDGLFMMAQAHKDVQNHTQAYASKAKLIHHQKYLGLSFLVKKGIKPMFVSLCVYMHLCLC